MAKDILSNLTPAKGSRRKTKRIGRGQGSGHGGTATKGHKGARARSGHKFKMWFEGGQMPLTRRVPKFGFTPRNRTEMQVVNIETLGLLVEKKKLTGGKVTPETLYKAGHPWPGGPGGSGDPLGPAGPQLHLSRVSTAQGRPPPAVPGCG